jgi:hypothetical protein
MKKTSILGAAGTAALLALPVLNVVGEIVEPDAESHVCSEAHDSACPMAPVSQTDVREVEVESTAESNRLHDAGGPSPNVLSSAAGARATMTVSGFSTPV